MKIHRISPEAASLASRICTALVLLMLACPLAKGEVPDASWSRFFPLPTSGGLTGVVWGDAGLVAVGYYGEVLFSENGTDWERVTIHHRDVFNAFDVDYTDGRYVIAVGGGSPLWSEDGRTWQGEDLNPEWRLRVGAAGGGKFVMLGEFGECYVSTNATDWHTNSTPTAFRKIEHTDNQWAGVDGGGKVYFSVDLTNWSTITIEGDPKLTGVVYGDGSYLVSGVKSNVSVCNDPVIYHSTNGTSWTSISVTNLLSCHAPKLSYANGRFFAVAGPDIITSSNGVDWVSTTYDWSSQFSEAGIPNQGTVAATPDGAYVCVGSDFLISTNLLAWNSLINFSPSGVYRGVAYAEGRLVVVGGRHRYLSRPESEGTGFVISFTDTNNWSLMLTNLSNLLTDVAYGQGKWVVCGYNGYLFSSADLTNWFDCSVTNSKAFAKVAYGLGVFVAIDTRGEVYRSTDATNWVSSVVSGLGEPNELKFVKDRFIAVAREGKIFVSQDGTDWEMEQLPTHENLKGIAYGKGRFVIVGDRVFFVSRNGTDWEKGIFYREFLETVHYADGWFIALFSTIDTRIAVSRDGINWYNMSILETTTISHNFIEDAGEDLILFGATAIYQGRLTDTEVIKQRLRPLLHDQLEFFGKQGFEYQLEHSPDLIDWEPFNDWTPGNDQYFIEEMGEMSGAAGFWRYTTRPE